MSAELYRRKASAGPPVVIVRADGHVSVDYRGATRTQARNAQVAARTLARAVKAGAVSLRSCVRANRDAAPDIEIRGDGVPPRGRTARERADAYRTLVAQARHADAQAPMRRRVAAGYART